MQRQFIVYNFAVVFGCVGFLFGLLAWVVCFLDVLFLIIFNLSVKQFSVAVLGILVV